MSRSYTWSVPDDDLRRRAVNERRSHAIRPVNPDDETLRRWGCAGRVAELFPTTLIVKSRKV
jgi:hypothetical protein